MSMTQLRLSIVICTYNGAAYLQQQLDSLLAQTRLPDEIVMSDDGSADASQSILQAFAERARGLGIAVQLWSNPGNLGYVENFSKALQQATGDVLFLCDQDDVWRPDKLALMATRFDNDPKLLLLHSDARLVDAQGVSLGGSLFDALRLTSEEKRTIHDGRAFEVVLRRSFVTGATAALRRELTGMALPVAPDWIHDEWLTAVAAAFGPMDFIDEPLIDYRQHDANQIGMRRRTLMMKWHDLLLSRGQMLIAEAKRWQRLEDFLAQARGSSDRAAQARHRRVHFEQRVAIGRLPRYRRLLPILREARAGSYRRYGTGGRSMLRDLLRHD
jgi:glycosyltransferase involved in cell wall biosynthesis